MPTADSVKAKLQGLIDKANSATGASDTTVTQAVNRLIEGYGSGGGDGFYKAREKSILDRSITEFVDDEITELGHYAMYMCNKMTSVSLPHLKTTGRYSFFGVKFTAAEFPELTDIGQNAFGSCTALISLKLPLVTTCQNSEIYACSNLATVDFGALTSLGTQVFYGDKSLTTVIIRTPSLCTLANVNAFTNTPIADGTGYVYVPSALVEDYKAATNWSTYADQIRAIEDYPEITAEEESE